MTEHYSPRRKLLKALGSGSVAAASLWTTPVVKSVFLPAHAQSSPSDNSSSSISERPSFRLSGSAEVSQTSTLQTESDVPDLDGNCNGNPDLETISAAVTPTPPDGTVITLTFSESPMPGDEASGSLPAPPGTPPTQTASTLGGTATFGTVELCEEGFDSAGDPPHTGDFSLTFAFQDQATFGTDTDTLTFRLIE